MFSKQQTRQALRRWHQTAKPSAAWRAGVVIAVIALALLAAWNARGQDVVFAECEESDYTALSDELTAQLTDAAKDPAAAFLAMRQALDMAQAKCTGGVFTRATNPDSTIGPLALDGTIYKISLQITPGEYAYGSVTWTAIEGDCGFMTLMQVNDDEVTGLESSVETFKGCTAIFDVSVSEGDWTLTIAKVK